MTANVGINIRTTADTRGLREVQREELDLAAATRLTETAMKNAGEENEELRRRIQQYAHAVSIAEQEQRQLGETLSKYDVSGVVRAYQREQYELGIRREVAKEDFLERQAFLKSEREERDQLRKTTIEQGIAERKAARDAEWASRRRKEALIDLAEQGVATLTAATLAFGVESFRTFAQFDTQIRQVATITDGGENILTDLTDDALILSKRLRQLPEEMSRALYQAESLGSDNIFNDVEESAKAAVAGNAELEATLSASLKTMNAYRDGMYDITDVQDIFFKAIDLGAIEMSDLAAGISEVTSAAGESGTRLEDVAAALVTMTKQGDSFNEAVELSALLLTQLNLEGTQAANSFAEATGKSYREFIAEGNNLAQALEALQDHANATGKSIGEIIAGDSPFYRDQQAARAAMELTGHHLDTMTESINEMYDAAGTMEEAYAIATEGAQRDLDNLTVSWEILKIRTGEYIASLDWVGSRINGFSEWLYTLAGGHRTEVEAMLESREAMADYADEAQILTDALQKADRTTIGFNSTFNLLRNNAADKINAPIIDEIKELNIAALEGITTQESLEAELKRMYGTLLETSSGYDLLGNLTTYYFLETEAGLIELGNAHEIISGNMMASNQEVAASFDRIVMRAGESLGDLAEQATIHTSIVDRQMESLTQSLVRNADTAKREVERVLDGDTIRFDGFDVRLTGVNTPEIAKGLFDESMPYGEEALEFTQAFLIDPEVTIKDSGRTDKYGRMLASILNGDGQDLESALVREGLALPLPVELTEDPQMTQRLERIARVAAAQGKGIFEREEIADAFLQGLISNQDDYQQYYEFLQQQDQAYYENYVRLIKTSIASHEELQATLQQTAIDQLLAHGDVEMIPQILDTAVALGVYTEEEIRRKEALALSTIALEEHAIAIKNGEEYTLDMEEATELLTTGLFKTREDAVYLATVMSGEMVDAFVAASGEGETLASVAESIGISIANIPSQKVVSFVADTSRWQPPSGVSLQGGETVKTGSNANIPAGIIPAEDRAGGGTTIYEGDTFNVNGAGSVQAVTDSIIETKERERFDKVMQ